MASRDLNRFLSWFQSNGGSIDTTSMDIIIFPASEGGRGAVAIKDVPEGHTFFTIPRSLTLSTRTSSLPAKFRLEAWNKLKLHKGWVGLILCMMWEGANGSSSKWLEYLVTLPTNFDTPMFWPDEDLSELKGTSVVEKLGRDDAENDYNEKLLPAVKSRPDLFPPHDIPVHYSLERYHIMGSRILSRSFNVEKPSIEEQEIDYPAANTTIGSGMDVDSPTGNEGAVDAVHEHGQEEEGYDGDSDSDEEDSSDTAMVPMADMLNARYETENAKLFYESNELRMVSTKLIKAGEQIWNTYGDLPNAELLRRYGHVDLLSLPQGGEGNPGDVVEVRADLLVSVLQERHQSLSQDSIKERIDWWLEEGGDDVLVFEYDFEVPPAFISLARLLLLPSADWEKARDKGKPPKPKIDSNMLSVVHDVLERRLKEYPTTLEEDEKVLEGQNSLNKRHAIILRIGEKRILKGVLDKIKPLLFKEETQTKEARKSKRKGCDEDNAQTASKAKKSRR